MKLFYSLFVFVLLATASGAQQLTPTVIASAGASFQAATFSIDYTLGETFITTLSNGSNILTQGFHQPSVTVVVNGCTNPAACNFNELATSDDGSCILSGDPCDDGLASTENDAIGSDCNCSGILVVEGCISPVACNYDSDATVDNGTCVFPGDDCNDGDPSTINDIIDSECICAGFPMADVDGCTETNACNFNPLATIDNGSCYFVGDACSDGIAVTVNDQYNDDCVCQGEIIMDVFGCMDATACNYEVTATIDNGSCLYTGDACDDGNPETIDDVIVADCYCEGQIVTVLGCTVTSACNYNAAATIEDGSCIFPGESCDDGNSSTENDVLNAECLCEGTTIVNIEGCIDATACNYEVTATIDSGDCLYVGDPCDDGVAATTGDVIVADCYCEGELVVVQGCTANQACNFNSAATIDDGSCIFPGDVCDDANPETLFDLITADCVCEGTAVTDVPGCTNVLACNYNPAATVDNGSCYSIGDACSDGNGATVNDQYNDDCVCQGETVPDVLGCLNIDACNYEPSANVDNGSCLFVGDACDDGNAETIGDVILAECYCEGTILVIEGCTVAEACNYDPAASIDNGSCEFPGGSCDDNNPATGLDVYNSDCVCEGAPAGCTDPDALNYDPNALVDNGTCEYTVLGCTDSEACNYNANANTDDGSCVPAGCNDPEACNFNPAAGCYDGNCQYAFPNYDCNGICLNDENSNGICDEYETFGCTDENAINFDPEATSDDESCIYEGCTDVTACNFDGNADVDDGSCLFPGCNDETACNYDFNAGCLLDSSCIYPTEVYLDCNGNCLNDGNNNGICDELDSEGCTDPNADNFNSNATVEDGSCIYVGCTDITACNFDPTALEEDGSCTYPGCTDVTACNFNPSAGCDDGSCEISGCTDLNACNYNSNALCDDGSCLFPGCNDVTACNYDSNAGCLEADSCTYPEFAYDCNGNCLSDGNNNGICDPFDNLGCTDPLADNYNEFALEEDGSCVYLGCTDAEACNFDATAVTDDGSCTYPSESCIDCVGACLSDADGDSVCDCLEIQGCTNPASINYNPLATEFDGSCLLGCTDIFAINYDSQANEDDGSCIYQILGCTYPTACNFNPDATTDNNSCTFPGCNDLAACNYDPAAGCLLEGSCEYIDVNNNGQCDLSEITGCTNADACNYNPAATFDDGSCAFDTQETIEITAIDSYVWQDVTYTESGLYEFTYVSVAGCDSVVVLDLTITTNVLEIAEDLLQIWPNPANHEVQVTINGMAADAIEVFDIAGKQVAYFTRKSRINVESWASGSYMLRVHQGQALS